MRMNFSFGWRKTIKISPTSCGISPHERLFFLLLFGVYGSIEIILSFEIVLLNLTFTEILSLELRNSNIAFLILHAWATRPWCKSNGKSPNMGGFDSTRMIQLLEIQAGLEVAASLETTKGIGLRVSQGIFSTSFIVELWALRDGLTLYNNLNLNAVDIQIDAKAIVVLLSNPSYSNSFTIPIVDDCRQLISQIPQVRIGHCFREANSCADFLARIGSFQNRDFILYNDPPVDLKELLSSDSVGLYCNILVSDPLSPP